MFPTRYQNVLQMLHVSNLLSVNKLLQGIQDGVIDQIQLWAIGGSVFRFNEDGYTSTQNISFSRMMHWYAILQIV